MFAWSTKYRSRVSPKVITHMLNVYSTYRSMKQKRRNFILDRFWSIEGEVSKLFEDGFIREVQYPKWLANMMIDKKAMGK